MATLTSLGQWTVRCFLPSRSTTIQAVIRQVPLSFTNEEMLTQLQLTHYGALRVHRLSRRDPNAAGTFVPTGSVRIDFDASQGPLPDFVTIYFERFSCCLYVPNPSRCTKCQNFGHTKSKCNSSAIRCPKCSGSHDKDACTTSSFCCPNCGGTHPSYSSNCPKYHQARHTEYISAQYCISYREALQRIRSASPPSPPPPPPPSSFFSGPPLSSPTVVPVPQAATLACPQHPQVLSSSPSAVSQLPAPNTPCHSLPFPVPPAPLVPNLSDICPFSDLHTFILDVHSLFQHKLTEQKLKNALFQLINNFYNPRLRRSSVSSKDSHSRFSHPPAKKPKKNK